VFSYEKFDDLKINESYKKIKYRIKEILKNNYPPKPVIEEYKIHELNQIIGNRKNSTLPFGFALNFIISRVTNIIWPNHIWNASGDTS